MLKRDRLWQKLIPMTDGIESELIESADDDGDIQNQVQLQLIIG